ncbi:hypothetical protein MBRA_44670 [Mycobacterium branderi]|uniref:Uncharacterized protein n=1 Tax=Mycobacterium branderi TaxID=43348 RepID=A0ABM7KSS6_9MYCO|nr:hypothetical protein MBRA_44670 [Mycobacterium branderi]
MVGTLEADQDGGDAIEHAPNIVGVADGVVPVHFGGHWLSLLPKPSASPRTGEVINPRGNRSLVCHDVARGT